MPPRTPVVTLSPAVLKWAREAAGYSIQVVSRRFHFTKGQLEAWETPPGPARLTLRQMEELAHYYKRPTAAFLLTAPPKEIPPPTDFRRHLHRDSPFSPELLLAIRRARRLRQWTREISARIGRSHASELPRVDLLEDAEAVARDLRRTIGVSYQQQLGWKSASEAFRHWRDSIELRRVPVFQAAFPRDEAQGFSLSDEPPFAIVVTTSDPFTARSFTLFHEFAHLLLRNGGVCLTAEAAPKDGSQLARVEDWCHRFAEEFLVDYEFLASRPESRIISSHEPGHEQALRILASSLKVSQHVILFRLWHRSALADRQFWSELARVQHESQLGFDRQMQLRRQAKGGSGPPPARQAVQERGRMFSRLVLEGLDREVISYTEARDYLDVRLTHLERVRQEAYS